MPIQSAGLLLYRGPEVFLIHMGGPIWAKRDLGAWSIPKGVISPGEDPLAAARREFTEETGFRADGPFEPLGIFRQNRGKDLHVWTAQGDCDPAALKSNHFQMIWPPKSGRLQSFAEADRGGWFRPEEAQAKIVAGQRPVLESFFRRAT
jgi:predicted NUDIX family NTP pyrophosphohydrolase